MTVSQTLQRVAAIAAAGVLLAACGERPPITATQNGFRGTGMDQVYNPRLLVAAGKLNEVPPAAPPVPTDGPRASEIYKNLQVLGNVSAAELTRTMLAITQWVAPKEGCAYCHNLQNLADDSLYTKVVARRMIQMTQHVNTDWKQHVAATGVTCYTCHRGNPVPANVWTMAPPPNTMRLTGFDAGQNKGSASVGVTSLPYDPFTPFLEKAENIRVIGTQPLPYGNTASIKRAEWTYGLMMHMSKSLGVNCTYCHNTRSFAVWDNIPPQRATAWYGIRMVRDLNLEYLDKLQASFPKNRLGPTGDVAKVNCATCHQGAYKPLYGNGSLLQAHPELGGAVKAAVTAPADAHAAATPSAAAATAAPTATTSAAVYFETGSVAMPADASDTLAPLLKAVQANAGAKVVLSGYHSATGSAAQNEELAKKRAFAVRDALKAAGVAEDRIVLEKPQQTEANASGEDRTARRVEVTMK